MEKAKINPEKITKPIQLLAVWFSGLVLLEGTLLTAARAITDPSWITPMLSVTAVVIIPIFIFLIFLMQTRFRPQMQDDSYYSRYHNSIIQSKNMSPLQPNLEPDMDMIRSIISEPQLLLNRLLPDINNIRLKLIEAGITNYKEFTPSSDKSQKEFAITIPETINLDFLLNVISLLMPFGLKFINSTIDQDPMLVSKNSITIGLENIDTTKGRTLEITDELIDTIKEFPKVELLYNMLKM